MKFGKIFGLLIIVLSIMSFVAAANYLNYTFEDGKYPSSFVNERYGFQIINDGANGSKYGIVNRDISDDQHAGFTIYNLLTRSGYLVFDYKVSSEEGYDFFRVYIDGNEVFKDSGIKDWQEKRIPITMGIHNITFKYTKDGSVSKGNDNVELDNIYIPLLNVSNSSDPDAEIPYTKGDLIINTSPVNTSNITTDFVIILKYPAHCSLYINNNIAYSSNNLTSSKVTLATPKDFTYYWYCWVYGNDSIVYDKSPIRSIKVKIPTTTVTFQVIGKDFNVSSESLYIATPCPKRGYHAIGYVVGYGPEWNPKGIYWQKLQDGYATFKLNTGAHNFCLFNGRVTYEENNFTTKYDVIAKYGILNLGNISIPTKINQFYQIRVSRFEIYDKTDPRAYNKTWGMLISSILGLLIGIVILSIGLHVGNGKIVTAGTLLVLFSLGFTFKGFLGVLI